MLSMSARRYRVALALLLAMAEALWLPPARAALDIDTATSPAGVRLARLSPDGKHIAAILATGLNFGLTLIDVETMEARTIVEGKRVRDGFWHYNKMPRDVIWVGNDLLAVDYGIEAESVNLNGKKVADLGEEVIHRVGADDADNPQLLVYTEVKSSEVALVNPRTGKRRKFSLPRGKVVSLAFDRHGQLRAATTANSAFWDDVTTVSNWYKATADGEWEKLADFGVADDYWTPIYVPEQDHTLIISSRAGRDTYALFNFDTKTRVRGDMLAGHPEQDILMVDGIEQDIFKSVLTSGMIPQQIWFDAAWAKVQNTVDAALPGRRNMLSGDPAKRVLINSYGDVDPGTWYILDTPTMALQRLMRARPEIDPAQMQPMKAIRYAARDGLSIPAFLTRPAAVTGPAPMVVMVHGGPAVRDVWAWDNEVQLLAANGYVVFQPQFRGSSGFGRKFEQAGYGQWGLAMQDDITSGVEHMIREGIADPKKICIYGSSYGGYAAMWGLAKDPGLYQCGISFAGVSDIAYMFSDSSDRNDNKAVRELRRSHIGDLKQNKERFDQLSPLKQAARISAPVLLIHGEEDRRVPIAHAEKMKRALEENHKSVQWLSFPDEGHGLSYVSNERLYLQTLLEFLDKHIGSAPAPAPAPAPAKAPAAPAEAAKGG